MLSGYTQADMVRLTGMAKKTYQRLERGQVDNPPIRYLVNCAKVLHCRVTDLCDPQWLEWTVFDVSAPAPPDYPPPKGKVLLPGPHLVAERR